MLHKAPPKALGFRMLALDLDGTLLNDSLEILPADLEAVKKAASEGIQVTLATGRPYPAVLPYVRLLGHEVYTVCYNGALLRGRAIGTMKNESILLHHTLHRDLALELVFFLQDHGFYTKVYIQDTLYVSRLDPYTRELCRHFGLQARETGDLIDFLRSVEGGRAQPTMIAVNPAPDDADRLANELHRVFGENITCHKPNRYSLNIVRGGATKVGALEHLARRLGIAAAEVIAIGDGDNDCDMIRWAGCGVAVANASQAARDAADWVTADNNSHGVAQALSFLLSWSNNN